MWTRLQPTEKGPQLQKAFLSWQGLDEVLRDLQVANNGAKCSELDVLRLKKAWGRIIKGSKSQLSGK